MEIKPFKASKFDRDVVGNVGNCIAHMGDITLDDLNELLGWIDEEIG